MKLLDKIFQRNLTNYLLVAEALALLVLFRACLAIVPVRRIIGRVTHGKVEEYPARARTLNEAESTAARSVQWAVRAAARHSPVEFVCFPQALAAYVMLRRRGFASTIVYGVARSPTGELSAHAWLDMGDADVVGGEEAAGFSPIERWD